MPDIMPFRGVSYDPKHVRIEDVVAPPYDVISEAQQQKLYERSPYNVVRLILGREEDRYTSAARHLEDWTRRLILVRDESPSIYVLWQTFARENGQPVTRKGFIALCRLEEFENGVVLPHERTLAKPREDRFNLLKAANANFSQVFSLYSDPGHEVDSVLNGFANSEPGLDVVYEDVRNRLWSIRDKAVIERVRALLGPKQAFIADGHHRYETALAYRDHQRSANPRHNGREPYNYVMMFFANIDDDGLVIFPTHRVVHSLGSFEPKRFLQILENSFVVREYRDRTALLTALGASSVRSFGLAIQGSPTFFLLSMKPTVSASDVVREDLPAEVRELDVTVLHHGILGRVLGISAEAQEQKRNLDYVRDAEEAFESVTSGQAQMAFLLNPTKIHEVRQVALAGHAMPQKSTYFHPKLLSGLVLNIMSE